MAITKLMSNRQRASFYIKEKKKNNQQQQFFYYHPCHALFSMSLSLFRVNRVSGYYYMCGGWKREKENEAKNDNEVPRNEIIVASLWHVLLKNFMLSRL